MARMGAQGYSSSGTTRLSAKVDEQLKRDFRDACDNADVTMTEAVEEMMAEFVSKHGPVHVDIDEGFYPDDPALCSLYEACLDVAEIGLRGPTVYQRRHASRIAQQTQQVQKNELADALMPLRRKGYVAQGPMPATLQGDAARRWRSWIVKPPEADPEQWKYREGER